jgi:hypothetical protein
MEILKKWAVEKAEASLNEKVNVVVCQHFCRRGAFHFLFLGVWRIYWTQLVERVKKLLELILSV